MGWGGWFGGGVKVSHGQNRGQTVEPRNHSEVFRSPARSWSEIDVLGVRVYNLAATGREGVQGIPEDAPLTWSQLHRDTHKASKSCLAHFAEASARLRMVSE